MSVYYKFNSELNYSHVDFDGLHIAVSDLKKAILHQKRLGKTADFDLLISNAQTKEEYRDEQCLIPKNTSLIVARIPISNQSKKSWEISKNLEAERAPQSTASESINHDITRMNGTEEDKIQAMMQQSSGEYDPSNYQRVRGVTQSGDVPANYRCHKCNKPGHWIKNCPMNPLGKDFQHFKTRPESKKMTGIPRSLRDNASTEQEMTTSQFVDEKREVPEDLTCAICKGIFKDAVMTPCCGSSFCDECVRTALLESDENECPDCKEKETSPGSLIPNRFLRNAVTAFLAESSNVLSRDNLNKSSELIIQNETEDEPEPEEELPEEESLEEPSSFELEDVAGTESDLPKHSADKDSESDDDDNITVTVPPAHQQSRGAAYRDSRLRRVPSHNNDQYSHPMASKNQQEDDDAYDDDNESYSQRHHSSKRGNHSYENPPQGISTLLGDDKSGNRDSYHSSASSQGISHGDSYQHQQHQQPPSIFNQSSHPSQHPGMISQMHPHPIYPPQGSYHQPSGPYYPHNQIRPPMRFEHQGNYQGPLRHHTAPSHMMRPSMHDNYNMRHHRPPINNLANAVSQNIQQRYGTGFIDDPLEAFNRIMREKEMRKERYRRSPVHTNERRSRSFERKRSPVHQYSPDRQRQKNYPKTRKRSRSVKSNSSYSRSRSRSKKRSTRGRSKSRSYSPRYRRNENIQGKERRDDRRRSPARRGPQNISRTSRSNYKTDFSSKQGLRDLHNNVQYEENLEQMNDLNFEYTKDSAAFEAAHTLDEQPPPPGDENEPSLPTPKAKNDLEIRLKEAEHVSKESLEVNGSSKQLESEDKKVESQQSKSEHHHHHKKSRAKNYDTSSEDKKSRDKKKRKKSREHEKKKNKKDRKERSDKEKKASSKTGSLEKTPEISVDKNDMDVMVESFDDKPVFDATVRDDKMKTFEERHATPDLDDDMITVALPDKPNFRHSESILDINPNIELDLDEWTAPEVSKWEREEIKSLDNSEADVGSVDTKKHPEEKVTSEILKRAENALFARAISAIRPQESKKAKEASPITSAARKGDGGRDSKVQAYQVTVPTHESGTRSIELKSSDGSRDAGKKRSPLRASIKNRLGIKVSDKKSRSRSRSRSPKRRIQSDCSKVVRSSGIKGKPQVRPSRERYPSSDKRRNHNKQLSSSIKVKTRDESRGSRNKLNDRKRTPSPRDKRTAVKRRQSRSPSKSRHNSGRVDKRANVDKDHGKSREIPRSDEKAHTTDQKLGDQEKSQANIADFSLKKRSRESSTASTSSSTSSVESQKHSKRHGKHKIKKKSRSPSAESNSISKRKKSKKEKKSKKKKKSRK